MKQYIVDAFTDHVFSGNPAAVCIMEHWLGDDLLQSIAKENNLSETAFAVKEGGSYHLRWFTPGGEIDLCGHATLATSFVILSFYEKGSRKVDFNTKSGILTVVRNDDMYEMTFPAYTLKETAVTDAMAEAFGVRPIEAWMGRDLLCVFEDEFVVRHMKPDFKKLMALDGLLQHATAKGERLRLRVQKLCSEASGVGGPCMRIGALPYRAVLVQSNRERSPHGVSGICARRYPVLPYGWGSCVP